MKFIIIRMLTCNQQMIRRNLTICRRRAITSRFFSKPRCMTRAMRWNRATPSKCQKYSGDDILNEDDHYAVVYNGSVGGTYDLMRKVTKEEILDDIDRYGLEQDASEDVKK